MRVMVNAWFTYTCHFLTTDGRVCIFARWIIICFTYAHLYIFCEIDSDVVYLKDFPSGRVCMRAF